MRRLIGISSCVICGLTLVAAATLPTSQAANPFRRSRSSVEDLAEKIDRLERALQFQGRITVKAPDVWGQARLTAHRWEFEQEMAKQLDKFGFSTQAEIAVSDQAFLSQAIALGSASQGGSVPGTTTTVTTAENTTSTTPGVTTLTDPLLGSASTQLAVITRTQPGGLLPTTNPTTLMPEPEILLDQRKRYLDHLHEIRRVNEGDDSADAPGYALNLVRIPISVIPGDKTRENYGAEVTVTAESHVTEELLPTTFRELVINDLIDQLSLPIVKILDLTWDAHLKCEKLRVFADERSYQLRRAEGKRKDIEVARANGAELSHVLNEAGLSYTKLEKDGKKGNAWQTDLTMNWKERLGGALLQVRNNKGTKAKFEDAPENLDEAFEITIGLLADERQAAINEVNHILQQSISLGKTALRVQSPRERRSRYPIPATQIGNVFGEWEIMELTVAVFAARDRFQCRDKVHLTDVQGFLRNELEHAYDFLGSTTDCLELLPPPGPEGVMIGCGLWHSLNAPTANEIRQPNLVIPKRKSFFKSLPLDRENTSTHPAQDRNPTQHRDHAENATESLAWAVLVESVLLNQHLNEDLQHVSRDPNCHCVPAGQPFIFYGPNPDPSARLAFVEYIKCRWPIRVFALDPVTQYQNVNDAFSLRREMQLAAAVAFSQRFMNAQSLTRYMRRIEQDIRTIALNPTIVGFGSGDDTFGWRFFPRVQTPDVEGTLTVLGRDLILGGPNKDAGLRRRRMEPGMRECVAIVVMPSFIKHVRFDVRTNWFPLVPCHTTTLHWGRTPPSMEQTMEWSKLIKCMEDSAMCCMQDQHRYRDGEVERLLKRSHQLSQELPLNTMHAQVPYENTLGGFEMFSSGVTDLAPELVGYYGAPGINPNDKTTLFLVGKNFSVNGTKLIAGNTPIDGKVLMSRQVMQVEIPKEAQMVKRQCATRAGVAIPTCAPNDCDDMYVEIRLATPYGVSSPLLVPVTPPACPEVKPNPEPAAIQLQVPPEVKKEFAIRYLATTDATTQKLVVETKDIRVKPPHRLEVVIPNDLPLQPPVSNATLEVRLNSIEVVGQPPADAADYSPGRFDILPEVPLSLRDGNVYVIEAGNFKSLHTNLKEAVVAYLQDRGITADKAAFDVTVKLGATVILDNQTRIRTTEDLPMLIKIAKRP